MTEKLKVDELLRLACLYAEQDRLGFAEANFQGTPEYEEAMSHAEQIRAYRLKRWGKTDFEVKIENATLVPVDQLRKLSDETSAMRDVPEAHASASGAAHKGVAGTSRSNTETSAK